MHGTGYKPARKLPFLREMRDRLNTGVINFGYRGFGFSEGKVTEPGIQRDVDAMVEFVKTVIDEHTEVLLIG